MTPSSPDPARPFYAIDDPEHPAPRDGTPVELRSNKYPAPQSPMICWFENMDTNWPWRFNDGTKVSDGVSGNWPTHWRPILDAEAGGEPEIGELIPDFQPSPPPAPSATPKEKQWTCFHCGEVFTDEACAKLHFGRTEQSQTACVIKAGAEGSLLQALRDTEADSARAWALVHNESTEAHMALASAHSRHAQQLQVAENLGYERSIKDYGKVEADLSAALTRAEKAEWERDLALSRIRCSTCGEREVDCKCISLGTLSVDMATGEVTEAPEEPNPVAELRTERDDLKRQLAEAKKEQSLNRKLRNEIRVLWKRLRDNAKVNWGMAKDIADLRARLTAALAAKEEAEKKLHP